MVLPPWHGQEIVKISALGVFALSGILFGRVALAQEHAHPWQTQGSAETVSQRFVPPKGYIRVPVAEDSFGAWLRNLPLLPGRPEVKLFNGRLKGNQGAQAAVLDVDVGTRDLQQCADAIMRLRAEYLLATGRPNEICFRFTDGTDAVWLDWAAGLRPQKQGRSLAFVPEARPDSSYAGFRKYLNLVFTYAGSYSLHRELRKLSRQDVIEPGDVIIKGGFPGHAVVVMDVAANAHGHRVYLLAQSYMPAQQIHILASPGESDAWYRGSATAALTTPEWIFPAGSLHRFPARRCEAARLKR